MSYFLEDAPQQPMAPRGPDQLLSTWMQGVGASFYQMLRDTNANSQRQMEVKDEGYVTAAPAAERLGIDTIYEKYKDSVVSMDFLPQKPKTTDELFSMLGPNAPQMVLDMAREQAKANPDAWKDLDLSEEGIQARVTEKRVKEDSEEQQILDLLPNGRGLAEFVGGAAGMIADVRQLPFLAFGGGEGSLLRIIGREAFLNTAAEAVTLPSQFETAKELGKPDPNVPSHLIQAAAGGAVLGGALHGLGRALEYFKGRSVTPKIGPLNEDYSNIIVSAAEDAIARGDNPIHAADHAMQALPGEALPDAAAFHDINAALDEFGPQTTPRIPEADRQFRVPQSATAIRLGEPALSTPATDIQTAVHNATLYRNARERDPVAFDAVQESQKKIATYRKWLSEMSDTQSKEVADIHATLDAREQALLYRMNTIQTGGRRAIKEELATIKTARQDAMTLANKVETPDMAKVRRALMDEDVRMREYGPRVAKALSDTKAKPEPWTPPQKAAPEIQWTVPARGPEPQASGRAPSPDNIPATEPVVRDTFSDPASAEARPILDTMTADIRDEITKGDDFLIDMGDGKGERMASTVLDDLDKGDAAAARFDLCGRGPA